MKMNGNEGERLPQLQPGRHPKALLPPAGGAETVLRASQGNSSPQVPAGLEPGLQSALPAKDSGFCPAADVPTSGRNAGRGPLDTVVCGVRRAEYTLGAFLKRMGTFKNIHRRAGRAGRP